MTPRPRTLVFNLMAALLTWAAPAQGAARLDAQMVASVGTPIERRQQASSPSGEPQSKTGTGEQEEQHASRVRFIVRPRPSLRLGEVFRVDFRVKLHGDFRGVSPESDPDRDTFDFNRRRLGVQGTLFRVVDYEVEAEVRHTETPWRDVFVNVRPTRALEVQAGKFKVPFSLERLTGGTDLDFVSRSLVASNLAPGRDRGVIVHGRLFGRRVQYQTGYFQHDGETGRTDEGPASDGTWAVRVRTDLGLRDFNAGIAATTSSLREGLHSFSGRAVSDFEFFEPVHVRGRRIRFGSEVSWTPGSLSVKGEFIRVQDGRLGQGLGDQNLPDAVARGSYVSGTWLVTGERKSGDILPQNPFLQGGVGAVELAARIEQIAFGSRKSSDEPFRGPRAANILKSGVRVWTVGVSWFANRWVKVQANAGRETFKDLERSPILGRAGYWNWAVRLQFVI